MLQRSKKTSAKMLEVKHKKTMKLWNKTITSS
uniref:Uncharacterized protein n=1 Tax=Tetranychus urticae TaxID=32264 RepID=T1JZQ5_TETUR